MSEIDAFMGAIGTYLPPMIILTLVACAVFMSPTIARLIMVMLFGVRIHLHAPSRQYLDDIHAFTNILMPSLPGKILRIEATPSHIYYLVDAKISPFKPDMWRVLSGKVQRPVTVYPAQNAMWVSVHYNQELEESYKPYLDLHPEQTI